MNRKPITMGDWISKPDDFLKLSGRDILPHAGSITHDAALQKAHEEFETFRKRQLEQPSRAETDFVEAESELKQIEAMVRPMEPNNE